jgi:hypothetical protein
MGKKAKSGVLQKEEFKSQKKPQILLKKIEIKVGLKKFSAFQLFH